jgi:hypothetical protein
MPTINDFETEKTRPSSKEYLDTFSRALSEGLAARNRNAAQESMGGGVKFGESKGVGGSSSQVGMTDDLTIVHHPGAGYGPMIVPGTPGKPGFGGVIGRVAGAGLGLLLGGPAGGSFGMGLGGTIGDSF